MKATSLSLFCLAALLFSQNSLAKKNLSAHEHGSATISFAYEQNTAEIELEAPADSVLGFEHAPKSDKEKKIMEDARLLWGKMTSELVIFPKELNCKTTETTFKQELDDDHHEHDKKHHKDKGESHSEIEASAKIVCEKPIAGDVVIQFKKHFKRMKNLKLEVVGAKTQSLKVKKDSETIKL